MKASSRILVFADDWGLPLVLEALPRESIVAVVGASIRPGQHENLRALTPTSLPVFFQPKKSDPSYAAFVEQIRALEPDVILVCSYSMLIAEEVYLLAKKGALNVHGANLPRYRGPNPVQWALINGEEVTGVTLHILTRAADEGPIVDQILVPIAFTDTWKEVYSKQARATVEMLIRNRDSISNGSFKGVTQNEALATQSERRTPEDGEFDWGWPALRIYNFIRALVAPLPGAFFKTESGIEKFDQYLPIAEVLARKAKRLPWMIPGWIVLLESSSLTEVRMKCARSGAIATLSLTEGKWSTRFEGEFSSVEESQINDLVLSELNHSRDKLR